MFQTIQTYTHQGKREYQEDAVYADEQLLLLADGMGGHARGDIASHIVVEATRNFLEQQPINAETDVTTWGQQLVDSILKHLNREAESDDRLLGMGSTLLLAVNAEERLVVCHVGDSRAYVIAPDGEVLLRTRDHSWVEEAVHAGLITAEEAIDHPKSNVVTRALLADPSRKVKPTVTELTDVPTGTRLFLCSDGVLEAWTNDNALTELIANTPDPAVAFASIRNHAEAEADDNNSAILATVVSSPAADPITEVDLPETEPTDQQLVTPDDSTQLNATSALAEEETTTPVAVVVPTKTASPVPAAAKRGPNRFLLALAIFLVLVVAFLYFRTLDVPQ